MTVIQKTDSRRVFFLPHAHFSRLSCNSFKCPSGYDPQLCCHYLYSPKAENTLKITFPLRVVQSTSPLYGLITKTRPNTSVFSSWLGLCCVDIHACSVNRLLLWPIPKISLFVLSFVDKVRNCLLFTNVAVKMYIMCTLAYTTFSPCRGRYKIRLHLPWRYLCQWMQEQTRLEQNACIGPIYYIIYIFLSHSKFQ